MMRIKLKQYGTAMVLALSLAALPLATAAERVALVIGNSQYAHGTELTNPINDANAVATELKACGFEVRLATELTHVKMEEALLSFAQAAKGAEAALFYFAGHGVEVGGVNYLVPIDANVEEEYQVKHKTLALDQVLGAMKEADAEVRLAVLDCCRDNPLGRGWTRSGTKGLAIPRFIPGGTELVYSTSPGKVALDGTGELSPFAAAFTSSLGKPNLELDAFFDAVGASVFESTKGKQRPWRSSDYYGTFFFRGSADLAQTSGKSEAMPAEGADADLAKELEKLRAEMQALKEGSSSTEGNDSDRLVEGTVSFKDGGEARAEWRKMEIEGVAPRWVLYETAKNSPFKVRPSLVKEITPPYSGAPLEQPSKSPYTGGYEYWGYTWVLAPVQSTEGNDTDQLVRGSVTYKDGGQTRAEWRKKEIEGMAPRWVLYETAKSSPLKVKPSLVKEITLPYSGALLEQPSQSPYTGNYQFLGYVWVLAPVQQ